MFLDLMLSPFNVEFILHCPHRDTLNEDFAAFVSSNIILPFSFVKCIKWKFHVFYVTFNSTLNHAFNNAGHKNLHFLI